MVKREAMSQIDVDIFCVLYNIINIIIHYYMFITYLSQANFGPLTRRLPHLINSEMMCYPNVLLSPFCSILDFHLEWWCKGENGQRKIREITKPAPYLSGSFAKNWGVVPIGKIPEKKKESLKFLGDFSARGLALGQIKLIRCWNQSFFTLIKFKCLRVKCWICNL